MKEERNNLKQHSPADIVEPKPKAAAESTEIKARGELEREMSLENIDAIAAGKESVFFGSNWIITLTRIAAFSMAGYHIYTSLFMPPINMVHRPVHLCFALVLMFLTYSASGKLVVKTKLSIVDIIGIIMALVMVSMFIYNKKYIMSFIWYVQPVHVWTATLCIITMTLCIIAGKRMVGKIFVGVVLFFVVYAWAGPYLPGVLEHRGVSITKFIDTIALIPEGIFGPAIQVSSTYIFNFVLFGAFLKHSNAGAFFIDIAMALAGASRGGPAKVAIFSSAAIGTISGSVVANVLTTGVFTIPMMKKIGYKPEFAGAVEASASTGGMIMPPIMGATAFVVAQLAGIPYRDLCIYAAIPAVLYFFSLVITIDLEAAKLGMKGLPKDTLPNVLMVLKTGWFKILPLVIIIATLLIGYSPLICGVSAIAACIVCSWFDKKEYRMGPRKIATAMIDGAISSVQVVGACACAGIIVGVVNQTGLGYRMGSIIMALSNGIPILALFFAMITAMILGMGLTVTPAYIIQASLIVPILINLDFLPIQAHLFAFYYSCLSAITPPVAIGAFAAAGVAGSENMKTGITAVRIAIAAFIIPYMFAFGPGLLLIGTIFECLQAIFTAVIGIIGLSACMTGYFLTRVPLAMRLLFLGAALLLIDQGHVTDTFGMLLFAGCVIAQYVIKRRRTKKVHVHE